MRVLIVDDDEALRELLARELSRSGHEVAQAPTAAAGESCVKRAEIDVVLIDLELPDESGIEMLRRLRSERPEVEVIVLTAHGALDVALAAMRLGAFDYLRKPCHLQELELTLERAFERRTLSRENVRLRTGLSQDRGTEATARAAQGREALKLSEVERRHIARVLAEVGGHRSRAAALLGISERNLYRKIHEHGLDRRDEDADDGARGKST